MPETAGGAFNEAIELVRVGVVIGGCVHILAK